MSWVLYFCSWAQRSTISTFLIQLSGQSPAAAIFRGRSNRSPCISLTFRAGILPRSSPNRLGAVQRDAFPVMPTQSIRTSRSLPGYSRRPRPTIWAYRLSDWVGRATMTVSTLGMSVPSVNTMQLTMQGISPAVKASMMAARSLVSPVTTTAPLMRPAISSAWWTLTAKISVAPAACSR